MKNKYKIIAIIVGILLIVLAVFDMIYGIGLKKTATKSAVETTTENETTIEKESETEKETTSKAEKETTSTEETTTEAVSEEVTEETSKNVTESSESSGESVTEATNASSEKNSVTTVSYTAKCVKSNSWESNGTYFTQFSCQVINNSGSEIPSWKFVADIGSGYKINNSWNGNFDINGSTLTITPTDWNKTVAAGSSAEVCGFIVEGPKVLSDLTYNGTATGSAANNNNSSNNSGNNNSSTTASTEAVTSSATPYTPPKLESGTPVANHGQLSVSGTNLVDCNGNKYQLKGVSTHGLQWFPEYVNKDTFKYLRDNWGANLIRLAMYTAEGGYCSGGADSVTKTLEAGVNYATELGMYVIIDWHILSDGNPLTNKESAKTFWANTATKYANYNNVIYEICNEPNGCSWDDVRTYANEIIPIIRKYDSDAVIICGTPTWSQDVDLVAGAPLDSANRANVMYAVHFYAATHGDNIRNKVKTAIAAGTPVFISEFSICDASGNGGIDYSSANAWKSLINTYNLSYAGWSLSNKGETSALIKSGVTKLSGFETGDLSDTGVWLRSMISGN